MLYLRRQFVKKIEYILKNMKRLVYLLLCILMAASCAFIPTKPIVQLSFMGFDLGRSLDSCLVVAKSNNVDINYKNGTESDGRESSVLFETSIADYLSPSHTIPLSVAVHAFDDIIYEISLSSKDYSSQRSLPAMYVAKYGEPKEGFNNHWEFENALLSVVNKSHTVSRKELDPSRAHLKLNNPENYYRTVYDTYFDNMEVTYTDKATADKRDVYQKAKKAEADSLVNVEKARQEAEAQTERARIEAEKEKAQKEIVNNLQF